MKTRLTTCYFFALLINFSTALFLPQTLYSEPANLSLLRQKVITYHDSGLYQQELAKEINKAQKYIIQQALLNNNPKNPKKLALVLDIDETSLSNYNDMIKQNFSADPKVIHKQILTASAPPILSTLALYQTALKHKVAVFFVTGRHESERIATEKNLINAGYTKWAGLYLRPNKYALPSIIPFKTKARAIITQKGYTIVAAIGDQYSDIRGGYTQKGFKLPNPFYYLP